MKTAVIMKARGWKRIARLRHKREETARIKNSNMVASCVEK